MSKKYNSLKALLTLVLSLFCLPAFSETLVIEIPLWSFPTEQILTQSIKLMIGGVFFIGLTQLLFYLEIKTKRLLLSGAFTLSLSIVLMMNQFVDLSQAYWQTLYHLIAALSLGLVLLYANAQFSLNRSKPKLAKLHFGLSLIPLGLVILTAVQTAQVIDSLMFVFITLEFIYLFCLGAYLFRHQQQNARTFCLMMTLLLLAHYSGLHRHGVFPQMILGNELFLATLFVTFYTLISSRILVQNINNKSTAVAEGTEQEDTAEVLAQLESALTKEKQANERLVELQENAHVELENKIQERTLELNVALQELADANRELEKRTIEDSLSKLYNRRHFDKKLIAEFRRAKRQRNDLCLVVLDIDHFKRINDTYGHLVGDKCIAAVGELLKDTLRRSTDMAFRYGGEEFCLLLPDTDAHGGIAIANTVRIAIEQSKFNFGLNEISFTASAGLTVFNHQDGITTEQIVDMADKALYKAKNSGRNQVQYLPLIDSQISPEEAVNV